MKFKYPDGATPIEDISGLIPGWVRTQEDLNLVEAENISQAMLKYLSGAISFPPKWFTVSFLQKIHREMLGDVWDWAGKFRTTGTMPGVDPYRIRNDLEALCSEVAFWFTGAVDLTLLEQAAKLHHQLVYIHPFPNGNGRFSRLISDRFLKFWKLSSPKWPIDIGNDGEHRKRYIDALRSADKGDLEPLIHYMQIHGAQDPALSDLQKNEVFQQSYTSERLYFLIKAYDRRGYKKLSH